MIKLLSTITLIIVATVLMAQNNIGTTYCEHNDLNASRYQPSELDFGNKRFQIGFNYDFWLGNKNIDYHELRNAFAKDQLTQDDIKEILDESGGINRIGVGQNYQVIGFGYQYRSQSGKKYDLAFTIVDRFSATIALSDNFLKLALNGNNNETFLGKTVNMGETNLSTMYSRSYAVNLAMPIFFADGDHQIRIGVRPKFIQGLASVNAKSSTVNMTTAADGDFIQMDFDYNYQTSGLQNFDPFKVNGKGYGLDLGITGFISKHFEIVASVLDIGSVRFDQNTKSYQKQGTHKFEGIFIPNLLGADPVNIDFEDEASLYNPTIVENEAYSVALPTKIGIELEYKTPEKPRTRRLMGMGRNISDSKKKMAETDESNISNTIYFTYIQGLNDMPGNTTRPFVSIGYMHDFHDFFDIGLSAAYGGFNNLAIGSFFAINIAHTLKIGFSSDNLSALILPKTATGFDISTNVSLSF
jgi:hypothetical protein